MISLTIILSIITMSIFITNHHSYHSSSSSSLTLTLKPTTEYSHDIGLYISKIIHINMLLQWLKIWYVYNKVVGPNPFRHNVSVIMTLSHFFKAWCEGHHDIFPLLRRHVWRVVGFMIGHGLWGYSRWNVVTISATFERFATGSQVRSLGVSPNQSTK